MPVLGETTARFRRLPAGSRVLVVLLAALASVATYGAATFLLLLALFGRSVHGAPPSVVVLGLPLLAALALGCGTFAAGCRFLDRRR